MKKFAYLSCLLIAGFTAPALADTILYGNNAGSVGVTQFDATTGAILQTFTGLTESNGRGVVVVGKTMYYTSANSANVYSYNLTTHTNNGVVFTVAGSSGLSTIAFDGTNFWIGDYSGTNHAYLYTPTGTLLKTVSLSNCSSYCDGLEYFISGGTGYLISNEQDGGFGSTTNNYDVYDLNGSLVTANFLKVSGHTNGTTGIAFDGTDFFTSNIFQNSINEWDANGNFIKTIALTGGTTEIEDLSADYSKVLPPRRAFLNPAPSSSWELRCLGLRG
jgi:hypothetical protein